MAGNSSIKLKTAVIGFCCLLWLLCLPGCVKTGEQFDIQAARELDIRNNITTIEEIVQALGPPKERIVNADGSSYMKYFYEKDSVNPVAQLIPGAFLFVPYSTKNWDVLEILEKDGIVQRYNIYSGQAVK